jgi:hypothetical protein
MELWLRSYFGQGNPGGAVARVALMPLPAGQLVSGSGTFDDPATLVVQLTATLKPGSPFVLPVAQWYWERYEGYPEVPGDEVLPEGSFTDVLVTLDGRTLIDEDNLGDFYFGPVYLDPPIVYDQSTDYGSVAAVFVQGVGSCTRRCRRVRTR